ncbi:MAG TPA: helix-hairpin-helix domain-containing protein, partial [Roseiflexaceae bacterium]|nr:helix-hairpin-helix domain-containing protein [Roseiflexaceae bacterium]
WLNSEQRAVAGLSELRDLLDLPGLPVRIECFDISNTQGTNSVGAMVVFEHGEPKKSRYRKFRIRTVEGANDVASMREVLRRRFRRAAEANGEAGVEFAPMSSASPPPGIDALDPQQRAEDEQAAAQYDEETVQGGKQKTQGSEHDETWAELPDLILIDGGAGQLNAALEVLRELRFDHIPTVGVVKGPNRDRFDLLRPGAAELLVMARDSRALGLIRLIDEEADRFAKDYHRNLRTKSALTSTLDEIPGIGPKRRRALLKAFGSLDGIRAATVEQLADVPGMNRRAAEELKELL